MDVGVLAIAVVTAPLWALLCAVMASAKNRSVGAWALGGLVFGLIGVLCLAVSPTLAASPTAAPGQGPADSDTSEAQLENLLKLLEGGSITTGATSSDALPSLPATRLQSRCENVRRPS